MRLSVIPCVVALALIMLVCACGAALAQTTPRMQAEALFVEAQKALSRGDSEGAEKLLKEALTKDASFTSAIWQLALVYESRGRLDYARELLLRGLRQDPGAAWARDKLAQMEGSLAQSILADALAHMNSGEYARAIPKLSTYLSLKPGDPKALVCMSTCHLAKGNLKTAREYLDRARASDPHYEEIPSLAAAIDERETSAKLETLVGNAQIALIDTTENAVERARTALQAVLKEDPGNSWARDRLGEINVRVADAEKPKPGGEKQRAKIGFGQGRKALDQSKGFFALAGAFALKHLILLALAAVLCVLVIDVRRKMMNRSYPLEGTVNLIPILDIVSLINGNMKTGRLIVVSADSRGEIYFEKGEIIHASCGGLTGTLAFHKLMDIRSGRFFFHNHLPNVRHTITQPLSLLLLSMKPHEETAAGIEESAGRRELFTTSR